MADIPVLYCDGFQVNLSVFGAFLRFGAQLPVPHGQPANPPAFAEQVRLGMGLPLLKVTATIIVREILRHETALKQRIEIPDDMLQSLGLPPAEWAQFWNIPPKPEVPPLPVTGAQVFVPK